MMDAERTRTMARVDFDDAAGPLLETRISGRLLPLGPRTARHALLRYPLMTLAVVWRIHWQALRLFLKKVRFFRKPAPPNLFTSR